MTTGGVVGMVIALTVSGIIQVYLQRMTGLDFMVVKREYLRFWFMWRLIFGGLAILGVLLYTWDFEFWVGAGDQTGGLSTGPDVG